jgi:hypothetical protein
MMVKIKLIRILLAYCFLLFTSLMMKGQNAPVTTATTIGNAVPGTITIPVTVTGFTNIGAISLSLDYDYSVLNFVQGTANPNLPGFAVGDNNLGTGYHRIVMGWYGSGKTLADGSTIMTLTFTFLSGITSLTWYDMGPSCEYADANYDVLNDIPYEDYYVNGYVCGAIGNPGTITGDDAVCQGETGLIYSVAPILNATGYTWTMPDGALIINGENTNMITIDYSDMAVSGNVTVFGTGPCGGGPTSTLPVTLNELPEADAGTDFSIPYGTSTMLYAVSGGPGTYSYHWSPEELLVDPEVQNPQTIQLETTTLFTLLVTDLASSCQNTDQVLVMVTGGPLNANPIALPGELCLGESSQLYANVGGGSESYAYSWTCNPPGNPPWSSNLPNPLVSPDTSTLYHLIVNDGYNTVEGYTGVLVFNIPTATISGGDTLCGTNVFTTLPVDLTGTPPWSFTYSFGSTTVFVNDQMVTPYNIIASDPGDYVISSIENGHCSGTSYGTAIVRKYPVPETPEITVYFQELISSSCCGNQWYFNGDLIGGATGQTYQVQVSGLYHVVVTLNNCSSAPSDSVDMFVGIGETQTGSFRAFPNPANGRVNIQTTRALSGEAAISLYSASGICVISYQFNGPGNDYSLDISQLVPGLYFLVISSDSVVSSCKIIIK